MVETKLTPRQRVEATVRWLAISPNTVRKMTLTGTAAIVGVLAGADDLYRALANANLLDLGAASGISALGATLGAWVGDIAVHPVIASIIRMLDRRLDPGIF